MAEASINEWSEAEADMECLLKLEPKNKKAQEMLWLAREELAKTGGVGVRKKGRKVRIEEVEEEEEEEEGKKEEASAGSKAPCDKVQAPNHDVLPMPANVAELKDQGNDLFRRGQYGEAVSRYSKALQRLETGMQSSECG
jgi:tetratricopeptide (TPR) repeat protein